MSWIDVILNTLFPPPVSLRVFAQLPPPVPHTYEPWIFTATQYRSDAKRIVRYLKETPDKQYAGQCARMIGETLEPWLLEQKDFHADTSTIYCVPVPQHKRTTFERGFSQSELLTDEVVRLLPYAKKLHVLEKIKKTEKQALLRKHKRMVNQIGSFACIPSACNKNDTIILIDDVSTTGSTLRECRRVLSKAGYKNIIAAVFAH